MATHHPHGEAHVTTTDGDLLTILTDRTAGDDNNQRQTAGLDVLTPCRNLYGWAEMNAVQSTQPRQLAHTQRDRQARQ